MEIRDRRKPGYFTIDNEVLDNYGLTVDAFALYGYLCRFSNNDSQKAYFPLNKFCEVFRVGKLTARKAFDLLVERKLVEIIGMNGRGCRVIALLEIDSGVKVELEKGKIRGVKEPDQPVLNSTSSNQDQLPVLNSTEVVLNSTQTKLTNNTNTRKTSSKTNKEVAIAPNVQEAWNYVHKFKTFRLVKGRTLSGTILKEFTTLLNKYTIDEFKYAFKAMANDSWSIENNLVTLNRFLKPDKRDDNMARFGKGFVQKTSSAPHPSEIALQAQER